jgi:hypothetical protein
MTSLPSSARLFRARPRHRPEPLDARWSEPILEGDKSVCEIRPARVCLRPSAQSQERAVRATLVPVAFLIWPSPDRGPPRPRSTGGANVRRSFFGASAGPRATPDPIDCLFRANARSSLGPVPGHPLRSPRARSPRLPPGTRLPTVQERPLDEVPPPSLPANHFSDLDRSTRNGIRRLGASPREAAPNGAQAPPCEFTPRLRRRPSVRPQDLRVHRPQLRRLRSPEQRDRRAPDGVTATL